MIRDAATGRVYLLTQQTTWPEPRRRWVNDLEAFTQLGFTWSDIALDWPTSADAYADAPAITYRPVSRDLMEVQTGAGQLTAVPFWHLQMPDDRLFTAPALAATYAPQWRELVAPRLAEQGVWITWGALPEQEAGAFDLSLNRITVNAHQRDEPLVALATTVTHETLHAAYPHGMTAGSCSQEEANAFAIEAQTWANRPEEYRQGDPAATRFEQQLASLWQQGVPGLTRLVASTLAYQRECAGTP